jgi:hypothetical protein
VFDRLYNYPSDKQLCTNPRKIVLRGEWNDESMIKNKISNDLIKAAGGLAARVEYARLSVNGDYFGFCTSLTAREPSDLAYHCTEFAAVVGR